MPSQEALIQALWNRSVVGGVDRPAARRLKLNLPDVALSANNNDGIKRERLCRTCHPPRRTEDWEWRGVVSLVLW